MMSPIPGQAPAGSCITFAKTSAASSDNRVRKYCPSPQQGPTDQIKIGDSTLADVVGILKKAKNPKGLTVKMRDAANALRLAQSQNKIPENTLDLATSLLSYQGNIVPTRGGASNNDRFDLDAFIGLAKGTADSPAEFEKAVFPQKSSLDSYKQAGIHLTFDNDPNRLSQSEIDELDYMHLDLGRGQYLLYDAFKQYGAQSK